MSNNYNKNNGNNEKKSTLTAEFDKDSFASVSNTHIWDCTSKSFVEEVIAKIMSSLFSDYKGANIKAIQTTLGPKLIAEVYFSESMNNGNGQKHAICRVGQTDSNEDNKSSGMSIMRVKRVSERFKTINAYKLTDDAKDLLSKYIINDVKDKNGNVKWNMVYAEANYSTTTGVNDIVSSVTNLDLTELVKDRFKNKESVEGKNVRYVYSVDLVKILPTRIPTQQNFQIKVTCLDQEKSNRAIGDITGEYNFSNIPMY